MCGFHAPGPWEEIVEVTDCLLASQDGIGYVLMESRFQFKAVDLMTAMILVAALRFRYRTGSMRWEPRCAVVDLAKLVRCSEVTDATR